MAMPGTATGRGDRAGGGGGRGLPALAVAAAVVGQLVVLVPFTVASGLVAPAWAVVALHLLWLVCAALLWRTAHRRPLAAPLVPLGNAGVLWVLVTLGDIALGWTA